MLKKPEEIIIPTVRVRETRETLGGGGFSNPSRREVRVIEVEGGSVLSPAMRVVSADTPLSDWQPEV